MKRRRREAVKQNHPSFQTLLERHESGLNVRQEFDRRRKEATTKVGKWDAESLSVFDTLLTLYPME